MIQVKESNKFGPLDYRFIVDFEESNGLLLPDDYKAFLSAHNGGDPFPRYITPLKTTVQWIFGMHWEPSWASLFHAIEVYHKRIPSWYIPIASDHFGNKYLMSLYEGNYGLIAFWDHENEAPGDADQYFDNLTVVASSFSEFVDHLVVAEDK